MRIYMAVSRDKYELPYAVADTAAALGKLLGVKTNTILAAICHGTRGYIRVEIPDEEAEK